MEESQYISDNARTNDPLANILADMSTKLEGISRLERKLDEVTTNFTGELDYLKAELSNLTEARKKMELNSLGSKPRLKVCQKISKRMKRLRGTLREKLIKSTTPQIRIWRGSID